MFNLGDGKPSIFLVLLDDIEIPLTVCLFILLSTVITTAGGKTPDSSISFLSVSNRDMSLPNRLTISIFCFTAFTGVF